MTRALVACLLCLVALGGCGGSEEESRLEREVRERTAEVRDRADEVRERADEVRADARELRARGRALRKRIAARVQRVLDDLEKAVPEASPTTRSPSARGRTSADEMDILLTDTIESVDAYWTQTLSKAGRREPRVAYVWVEPGDRVRSACGAVADDTAAFYCPADDTIYVAKTLAAQLYAGVAEGFPGQRAGYGQAVGDFGVAYIVAHEYAHNLQQELGFFRTGGRGRSTRPFELQADCMAGLWGNSVYRAGKLKPGDVEEAMSTALAVGDFDYGNEQHHGTPEERRDAWLLGFESGEPADCARFAPAV